MTQKFCLTMWLSGTKLHFQHETYEGALADLKSHYPEAVDSEIGGHRDYFYASNREFGGSFVADINPAASLATRKTVVAEAVK